MDQCLIGMTNRHLLPHLWRAVDEDGNVIDILMQSRRHRRAAIRFFRKLLKGRGCVPRRLITDKLLSYPAACRLPHSDAVRRPLHGPVREQPGGSFPPADPAAGASDARLQVGRTSPAVRLGPWRGPESLPAWAPSAAGRSSSGAPHPSVRRVERRDVCFLIPAVLDVLDREPDPRPPS